MNIKSILAAIGGLFVLIIGAFLRGQSSGKEEVHAEVKEQHTKDVESAANIVQQNSDIAQKVSSSSAKASDSDVDKELLDKWTRD